MKQNRLKIIFLLSFVVFILNVLVACGSDDFSSDQVSLESISVPTPEWVEVQSGDSDTESIGNLNILSPTETGRQLVYTTDINLETTEFMMGMRLLLDQVIELDGYSEFVLVNGRSLSRPDVSRRANFTLRIPTDNLAEFIIFIENNYNLVRLEQRMVDFSNAHNRDLSELEDLRLQEQELIDNDGSQRDLSDVRRQIRNLEQTTANLQNRVIYSTISISLLEVLSVEAASFGSRASGTLGNSFIYLLEFIQIILIVLIAITPWLIPVIIIAGTIVFFVKRSEKKKKALLIEQLKK